MVEGGVDLWIVCGEGKKEVESVAAGPHGVNGKEEHCVLRARVSDAGGGKTAWTVGPRPPGQRCRWPHLLLAAVCVYALALLLGKNKGNAFLSRRGWLEDLFRSLSKHFCSFLCVCVWGAAQHEAPHPLTVHAQHPCRKPSAVRVLLKQKLAKNCLPDSVALRVAFAPAGLFVRAELGLTS